MFTNYKHSDQKKYCCCGGASELRCDAVTDQLNVKVIVLAHMSLSRNIIETFFLVFISAL